MNGPNDLDELDKLPAVEGADREALEAIVSRALRPVEPPNGFADAVLRRTVPEGKKASQTQGIAAGVITMRRLGWGRLKIWLAVRLEAWGAGALVATALALAVFGGQQVHERHEQERRFAERRAVANQQFEAAVRITDQTVEQIQVQTREQLRRAGMKGVE